MIETAQQIAETATRASDRYLFLFSQVLIVGGMGYVIRIMFVYLQKQADKLEHIISETSALIQKTNTSLDLNTHALNENSKLIERINGK